MRVDASVCACVRACGCFRVFCARIRACDGDNENGYILCCGKMNEKRLFGSTPTLVCSPSGPAVYFSARRFALSSPPTPLPIFIIPSHPTPLGTLPALFPSHALRCFPRPFPFPPPLRIPSHPARRPTPSPLICRSCPDTNTQGNIPGSRAPLRRSRLGFDRRLDLSLSIKMDYFMCCKNCLEADLGSKGAT